MQDTYIILWGLQDTSVEDTFVILKGTQDTSVDPLY